MPRVDNSDDVMIEIFDLDFNPKDPGMTPAVDFCKICITDLELEHEFDSYDFEIDHPNYDNDPGFYTCFNCGEVLTNEDN